jgi:hypothetical protein
MTKLSDLIDAGATGKDAPEKIHYYGLADAFIATLEELSAERMSTQEKLILTDKLASDYYALIACAEHAKHVDMHHVYEVVVQGYGIDQVLPLTRAEQKRTAAKYEAEYLDATELELIKAQNTLRMPRLSKAQRQMHEDDVTFYGAELVCHERYFKSAALRRRSTKLIEEHKIDRAAPLQYHRA